MLVLSPSPFVITQAVAKYLHRFFASHFEYPKARITKGGRILAIRLDFSLRSKRSFFERMTSKGSYTTQADFKICGGAVVVLSDFWGRARHKVCGCLKNHSINRIAYPKLNIKKDKNAKFI